MEGRDGKGQVRRNDAARTDQGLAARLYKGEPMILASAGTVIVWIVVVLFLIGFVGNAITKNVARAKGRNVCAFCRSRLKWKNGKYGTVCRKCGREQPWAAQQ